MARPRGDARERILNAAVDVLRKDGVGGFSQPKVAKRAEVPQGHLTYYFPKRADLLHEVTARFSADIALEGMKLAQDGGNGFDLIERLARDKERTRILVGLLVESESDATLAAALEKNTLHVLAALGALLDIDDDVRAELVLCALWGIGLRHLNRQGRGNEKRTNALLDLVRTSLVPALKERGET
jgi:AcrR family transcriptional regulator